MRPTLIIFLCDGGVFDSLDGVGRAGKSAALCQASGQDQ
jgi:hypothetical protein